MRGALRLRRPPESGGRSAPFPKARPFLKAPSPSCAHHRYPFRPPLPATPSARPRRSPHPARSNALRLPASPPPGSPPAPSAQPATTPRPSATHLPPHTVRWSREARRASPANSPTPNTPSSQTPAQPTSARSPRHLRGNIGSQLKGKVRSQNKVHPQNSRHAAGKNATKNPARNVQGHQRRPRSAQSTELQQRAPRRGGRLFSRGGR